MKRNVSRLFLILAAVCSVLAIAGGMYVFNGQGTVHPAFSGVPSMLTMLCLMVHVVTRPKR